MLSSAIDINDVFQTIVRSGLEITNTPAGSLALYDEEKKELELTAVHGFSPEFSLKATRWKVRPGGLTSRILSQKQPVVVPDITEESVMDTRVIFAEGIRSLVATPLTTENKIVGILYMDDYKPRTFTKETFQFWNSWQPRQLLRSKRLKYMNNWNGIIRNSSKPWITCRMCWITLPI